MPERARLDTTRSGSREASRPRPDAGGRRDWVCMGRLGELQERRLRDEGGAVVPEQSGVTWLVRIRPYGPSSCARPCPATVPAVNMTAMKAVRTRWRTPPGPLMSRFSAKQPSRFCWRREHLRAQSSVRRTFFSGLSL